MFVCKQVLSVALVLACFANVACADFVWVAGLDFVSAERDAGGNNVGTETNFQNQIVPVWSFGSVTTTLGAGFVGVSVGQHVNDLVNGFFTPNSFDGFLTPNSSAILVNYTNAPSPHFQGTIAPKEIILHPAQSNAVYPTIRFTVPTTATYSIQNYWRHLNTANPGDGGRGHVVRNGVLLDTQSWAAADGTQHSFNASSLSWVAGDVIDFIIDAGAVNDFNSDSTAFNATITAVPEPSTLALFGTVALTGGALNRRRKTLQIVK